MPTRREIRVATMEVHVEPEAEKPRKAARKPRITVVREEESLVPAALPNGVQALVASSEQQLEVILGSISIDQMHSLHEQVAAWEEVQKRLHTATEEIVRIATVRLRIERKIGQQLAQTVKWGGHGSRSDSLTSKRGGSSSPLPQGINKQRASWYRSIAKVPEDVFEAFLAERARKGKPPTATALRKSVAPPSSGKRAPKQRAKDPAPVAAPAAEPSAPGVVSAEILDAVGRLMDVNLVVGDAAPLWPDAARANPEALKPSQLQGNVIVTACPDPSTWLPKLARARGEAKLAQIVVVLPFTGTVVQGTRGWRLVLLLHSARDCRLLRGADAGFQGDVLRTWSHFHAVQVAIASTRTANYIEPSIHVRYAWERLLTSGAQPTGESMMLNTVQRLLLIPLFLLLTSALPNPTCGAGYDPAGGGGPPHGDGFVAEVTNGTWETDGYADIEINWEGKTNSDGEQQRTHVKIWVWVIRGGVEGAAQYLGQFGPDNIDTFRITPAGGCQLNDVIHIRIEFYGPGNPPSKARLDDEMTMDYDPNT